MQRAIKHRFVVLGLAAACLGGCGSDEVTGTLAFFDPALGAANNTPEAWLKFPFPADFRRLPSGNVSLMDYPGRAKLAPYITYGEAHVGGFGTNSAVYVAFEASLDGLSIPSSPPELAVAGAALQLVDITPSSAEYGRRRPLRWDYWDLAGKYVAAHTLAAAPAWGFPLREQTTYAFLVTTDVRGADGNPLGQPPLLAKLLGVAQEDATVDESQVAMLAPSYAPLQALLEQEGFDRRKVAVATVFTTQAITPELAAIHAQINDALPAPALDSGGWQELGGAGVYSRLDSMRWRTDATVQFHVMEGRFSSPNFQHGDLPYLVASDGGGLEVVDGVPQVSRMESLRFVLTIPAEAPPDGGSCYPLTLYAHGTGGDAHSFRDDGTAGRLAARGIAGLGIDQPLHGLRAEGRDFEVNFASFNFNNPLAACTCFRQSAADTFSVARFARESLIVPADKSPTGQEICFDPARVSFFGHSHGALSGALAAAFESELQGFVLSGGGGGLSITLMERHDTVSFLVFITQLAGLGADDESLSEMHPVISLLQMVVEITDPINYAPRWLELAAQPRSMLVTSGAHDEATPARTAAALAVAGATPVVAPVAIPIPEYEWAGMPPVEAPVFENVGPGATAGFLQWTNDIPREDYDSHFVIFNRPEAINASMRFLQSAAYESGARIERDPDANVR